MLTLTIRTDKPDSEIGLYDGNKRLAYETWAAHRQLAETLHTKLQELLKSQHKDWHDIESILAYRGPGSFTGLRIGLSVANALAESLGVAIVGADGENWLEQGLAKLADGEDQKQVMPEYGGEVFTTPPKK